MFGKELAHDEVYYKEYGEYKIAGSYSVYESYIEEMYDREGKALVNKDGSPRYRYVNDKDVVTIKKKSKKKKAKEFIT